jgi:hypothetical protein
MDLEGLSPYSQESALILSHIDPVYAPPSPIQSLDDPF